MVMGMKLQINAGHGHLWRIALLNHIHDTNNFKGSDVMFKVGYLVQVRHHAENEKNRYPFIWTPPGIVIFNKGDKVVIRHKNKNGKSQFSWATRIVTLEHGMYYRHETMPNRCLFHDENRCLFVIIHKKKKTTTKTTGTIIRHIGLTT